MRRVLVYGNSHVAAWQAAWEGWTEGRPALEMAFFSLPERIFQRYRFRASGRFAARRSVTAEELDRVRAINAGQVECHPADADVAVCVGLSWAPERAMGFAALGDAPGMGPAVRDGARALFSAGFVEAAFAEACAETCAAWPLPPRMAGRTVVFGRPIYAETCLRSTHPLYAPWRDAAACPEAARAFLMRYADRLAVRAREAGVAFIAPPPDVAGAGALTRAGYLAAGGGGVNPDAPGARGDHSHMNAAYGRACIRHLLAHLAGAEVGDESATATAR
ncbi:hypothetical protein [Paragemmobacter ruber]|uniref:SGNH/GDSL hydrolase family protein n=1 Tax=Paragemmobacter ruber TaxID=1985673 RepID=A0ABW9Y1S5_9RHOB|nr:hypothetical protein [Rhodobacter ruber]NBE06463.1 hypothetical protein [Rhodobacter ruber]